MKTIRMTALAGVLALAVVLPATAAATTVHPAGHVLDMNSQPVSLSMMVAGSPILINCTVDGGRAGIPAAPNNSVPGTLMMPLSVRPAFSSCSGTFFGYPTTFTVTTSGVWTVGLTHGSPSTAKITIPTGGLAIEFAGVGCVWTNTASVPITGTWQNWQSGSSGTLPTAAFPSKPGIAVADLSDCAIPAGTLTIGAVTHQVANFTWPVGNRITVNP